MWGLCVGESSVSESVRRKKCRPYSLSGTSDSVQRTWVKVGDHSVTRPDPYRDQGSMGVTYWDERVTGESP